MKSLLSPKWLFLINSLPVLVLTILSYQEFSVIKTLLSNENIWQWKSHAYWLVVFGVITFGTSIFLIIKKRVIPIDFAIFLLLAHIAFIYSYYFNFNEIVPSSIPQWMLGNETMLYVGTFLMPTLAYSLFILVVHFTPENKKQNPWKSFGFAILVPISWYVFVQVLLPFWQEVGANFNEHFIIIILVSGILFFLFFLIRGLFIVIQNKSQFFKRYQIIWKVLFTILLPLLGLLVNSGHLFSGDFSRSEVGFFGDFNSFWFYFLAIFNGVLLCIPNIENKIFRFSLFLLRTVTFAFTLYFFIVFLPFLPFSIIAIIAFGLGFLMLSPLVLFTFHIFQLAEDFNFLKQFYSKNILKLSSIISILIIPTVITLKYLQDKSVLTETVEFVYTPNYSKNYSIDHSSLESTLKVIKSYKNNRNDFFSNVKIPYLTSYFNWLVLDNLTLSDAKISTIENVFFAESEPLNLIPTRPKDSVVISNISTKSTFDENNEVWKTWVNFEMKDETKSDQFHEFSTVFNLPNGCYISNYYLDVNEKREYGILAEKKSALWIYNQITRFQQDPGILYYLSGNRIAFKVFPFSREEVRKTGIEFLHKEPVKLTFENQEIQLGENTILPSNGSFDNKIVKYISANEKKNITPIKRKPYIHFIVDVSKGKEKLQSDFKNRIDKFNSDNPHFKNVKKSFVDYDVNPSLQTKDTEFKGGFNLDRALKKLVIESYNLQEFPVFVVVTDSLKNAILDSDYKDLSFTFPENKLFFNLEKNGNLSSHNLLENPKNIIENNVVLNFDQEVIPYQIDNKNFYLENDNQASLILKTTDFSLVDSDIKAHDWNSAFMMQAKYQSQLLQPESMDKDWLKMVRYSFKSKIMTPFTSYLVVETEAQKKVLERKQKQVLNGNFALDAEEVPQQMSEPELIYIILLMLLFVLYLEFRKRNLLKKVI